ncbi:hypothetical protein [Polaromonas sp. UC242_47]|uniref:hypothetical protein n=1 Tax=Polaromonas sp. UC242_47 TaxID=3374626 RepID=UPI0037B1B0C4
MAAHRPNWIERRASRLVAGFGIDRTTALIEAEQDWQSLHGTAPRNCCDQKCLDGGRCASFAPGVVEGPYRRSMGRRAATQARDAFESAMGGLLLFWDYLKGPRP